MGIKRVYRVTALLRLDGSLKNTDYEFLNFEFFNGFSCSIKVKIIY